MIEAITSSRRPKLATLALASSALLLGCATNRNDPIATYRAAAGGGYEITMTGLRENMAHDPISFLFRGSSPSKATLRVPRITGQVQADEVFRKEDGGYRLVGKIEFTGSRMLVDFQYDEKAPKRLIYDFNGEYVLRAETSSP